MKIHTNVIFQLHHSIGYTTLRQRTSNRYDIKTTHILYIIIREMFHTFQENSRRIHETLWNIADDAFTFS